MTTMNKRLEIKLYSDLCSGSGLSYAGVIDSDVVYDEWGFPYIPARRLKGCMREAAKMIGIEDKMLELLFGKRGNNEPGCLQIGNAVLEKAECLKEEIECWSKQDGFETLLTSDNILKMYTSVRAQTRINQETYSAEDNTLRFTRVVNQFDPLCDLENEKDQRLCFYADISWQAGFETKAKEMEVALKKVAKATRNIGINRNRGLGSVRCRLIPDDGNYEMKKNSVSESDNLVRTEKQSDGTVKISYMLENTAPLVLSEEDESGTISYISGKSILGALAGSYIRRKSADGVKNPENSDEFRDLFLKGKVKYANAYPACGGLRSYPAPLYLNKLKKTEEYINVLRVKKDDFKDDTSNGNQPKLLKSKFVAEYYNAESKLSYRVTEPEKEISYHHIRNKILKEPEEAGKSEKLEKSEEPEKSDDQLLYSLEYLKSGQRFVGEIFIAPDKESIQNKDYVSILEDLLKSSKLRFGKSRSAQYGTCELVEFPNDVPHETEKKSFKAENYIVVTFKSDGIFMNDDEDENGNYTVNFSRLKKLVGKAVIGPNYRETDKDKKSIVNTKEVVGYNTMWNMKRPAVPAVKAGSAFIYKLEDDLNDWPHFIGERTQEGFGEIEICLLDDMKYKANKPDNKENQAGGNTADMKLDDKSDITKIICSLSKDVLIDQLMLLSLKNKESFNLKSSNIGRITLMLKESLNKYNDPQKPDEAANDFWKRIESIKSEYRSNAEEIAERTTKKVSRDEEDKRHEIDPGKMFNLIENSENSKIESVLSKMSQDTRNSLLKAIWGEYMLQYLTMLKYECK